MTMRLNGWQRLWVVVVGVWLLLILAGSYWGWPTAEYVSRADVLKQMKAGDAKQFLDYCDFVFEQPQQESKGQDSSQSCGPWSKYQAGQPVEIGGHTLQFINGLSQEQMNHTAGEYYGLLRSTLAVRRAEFAGDAFALWIVPAVALYAVGWAIGWIRRGFSPTQ